jgi:dUTPase
MRLYICPEPAFVEIYENAVREYNKTPYDSRNSGFDLFCNAGDVDNEYSQYATLVGQGCKAVAVDAKGKYRAYWLTPRSSISKTPWRLANSMGLIDATYRGTLKAALDKDISVLNNQRLVQLAQSDLLPWDLVSIVSELPGPNTIRGAGGFGSTGF